MQFFGFSEEATREAIRYVVEVFDERYRAGQLKVAMSHENGRLYGYALLFFHPKRNEHIFVASRACQKRAALAG